MFSFLAAEELLAVGMNHRMAPFLTTNGSGLSMICEGKFNLGSACIQRTAIDALNLLFLCLFYILLLFQSFTTQRTRRPNRRFSRVLTIIVSACSGVISISCLGSCLWDLAQQQHKDGVLAQLVRGLIWFSLTLSILVRKSNIVEILVIVWWVCFPLLLSALCVETLIQTHEIQFFYIVSWPTSLMLLMCAIQSITSSCGEEEEEASELVVPLIEEKGEVKLVNIEEASFYGKLIFSWINPLLSLGYSKPLSPEDIPCLSSKDESNLAYQKFSDAWQSAKLRSSKSSSNLVIKAITRVYWKEHVAIAICAFLRTVGVVALPLVLYAFVNYSNREETNLNDGLKILFCLIFLKLMESFSQRHWFFDSRRSGMRMRSALMVAVYEKQLNLSISGRRRHSTGEIVNYIAVDAYRMGEFPWWFHTTWSSTLQLFMSIAVLFFIVGLSALPGLIPLLICGLLNVPFARILQNCQSHLMASQDQRLRATSEILNNIKIIKLQAWEGKFRSLIENLRGDEFHWLSKLQLCRAYGGVLYWMSPTVVSSVVFTACAVFGTAPLDAGTIFTVLATLRAMGEPVRMIPEALSNLIQVKVSFHRINGFLLDDDDDDHDQLKNNEQIKRTSSLCCGNISVKLESGNFSWDTEILDPTVKNVNLEVRNGQKFAVCGPVGAGKSSLLYAILGEIPKLSGTVNINGSIAYVAQTSWIQSGTVRDNILYGRPMEEERYEKAIKACALDKDISSFDYGDLTEIGQRGINMSGGQKQRIQLARALYSDADIYLLDDPFSAVDAQTAAVLFNECVMNALKKKTVILVTHQVEFLSGVDKILVMEGGKITQMGNYEELLSTGTPFEKLVNAHKGSVTLLGPFKHGVSESTETVSSVAKQNIEGEITVKCTPSAQLTEEEERVTGDVGWRPFIDYITLSKSYGNFLLSVIAVSGFVICQAGATYWLAFGSQVANISSSMLIGVYAGIAILSAVFTYFRSLFAAYLGLQGSKAFFSGFTDAIFKAPMLFFDSTPVGRILTRASSDMSILDFDIPYAMIFVITVVVELIASFIIMASITWQVLVVVILVLVGIKHIQAYYLATARELIRINGTTKAPVMNYAAETSLGVVTIRAFKMVDRFFKDYQRLVDKDASLFLLSNAAMEWLVMRVEALQNMTIFATAFFLILIPKTQVTPGLVGLSLSYALPLTGTQIFLTRWYCNLSNYIISVERIKQFMSIPSEPPAIIEERRPPSHWPSKGRIELHDLKIRYRPNAPTVLKGITCTFQEGTRIGVVGRTGSGKTTLISALFRLVEPAGGNILVDGVDICSIGLRDLRTKLSIIPQEPALFKGSVRTNLDPLGLYSDDDIWKTLEKCQLHGTISSLPDKLDTVVSDEGENWSAGQRQLFCLGRVLLKKNRILVLDEATASIDSTTDAILQRIIRQEFSECTVITVAHRVPTVIDSDMVMVLYFGEMVEYDQPAKLMKTNSSFSKLVAEYWSSCRRDSNQDFNSFHE